MGIAEEILQEYEASAEYKYPVFRDDMLDLLQRAVMRAKVDK